MILAVLLFAALFILILLGVPIAFSLGGAVLLGLLVQQNAGQYVILSQRIFTALDGFTLMAIPFFVLSGNLMSNGGISRRLVVFLRCCFVAYRLLRPVSLRWRPPFLERYPVPVLQR